MDKKICLVTGCSGGIGKAVALQLARMGHSLIMLVRNSDKSREAWAEIQEATANPSIRMVHADLSSRRDILTAAEKITEEYPRIDVLIHNAGVYKRKYQESEDGIEMTLAVNYLAPFHLSLLLLPLVKKSPRGRIVNVTSELYKRGQVTLDSPSPDRRFKGNQAYADSKMLLMLFTRELARRLSDTSVTVNAVHPGVVASQAFREYPRWVNTLFRFFLPGPAVGARSLIYAATDPAVENRSGAYFRKTRMTPMTTAARDPKAARNLWRQTEIAVISRVNIRNSGGQGF